MSVGGYGNSGNGIVTDGLIFYVDAYNTKSNQSVVNNLKTGISTGGTLTNGTTTDNYGWSFDGTNDYIDFGDLNTFNFQETDPFTLSIWKNTIGTEAFFIQKLRTAAGDGWQFYQTGRKFIMTLRDDVSSPGGNLIVQNRTPSNLGVDNVWQHLVATYDGSSTNAGLKIYVNGVDSGAPFGGEDGTNLTINYGTSPLRIGVSGGNLGSATYTTGKISNIKIYNRALSASEVLQNYNALKWRFR